MGITFSKIVADIFGYFTPYLKGVQMAPYAPLPSQEEDDAAVADTESGIAQNASREDEVVSHKSTDSVNFRSLKDHPDALDKLITSNASVENYDDNIVDSLTSFVERHINKDHLRKNTFSKKIWGRNFETTREYIVHIFQDAISQGVTVGKLMQCVIQSTVIDEFSGFTIHDARLHEKNQAICLVLNQIKHKNMEYIIGQAFDGVDSGVLFLTEYDHPSPIALDGIAFTQLQTCGNRSKAVVYKSTDVMEIISYEKVKEEIMKRHKRSDYIVKCLNHKDTPEMFQIFKIGDVYFVGTHLKSVANRPAAKKNVPLYITIKCIIDWLKELGVEIFLLGDMNVPFLHEDTYIGFNAEDASWFPLLEPAKEHCINYEFTRISPTHADTRVMLKVRSSDCTKNAQGSIGKYYEDGREGITDFVFHYVPRDGLNMEYRGEHGMQQRTLCQSEYDNLAWESEYSPQNPDINCIPYVTDEVKKSFCSDHQILTCKNGRKMIGTWNVLSQDASSPAAYKEGMSSVEMEKANDELADILHDIYKTVN